MDFFLNILNDIYMINSGEDSPVKNNSEKSAKQKHLENVGKESFCSVKSTAYVSAAWKEKTWPWRQTSVMAFPV